ncbi:hypothetical protein OZ13_16165 [Xanthomonas cannabis pv. cannabis]|nr:hypothetical protein OZ13_16165 [Xanthomonas cannabis pv. cannabis]
MQRWVLWRELLQFQDLRILQSKKLLRSFEISKRDCMCWKSFEILQLLQLKLLKSEGREHIILSFWTLEEEQSP